jgi:4-amino-4-deoxy-L-arabinose transferase-like glycosyltransferase
MTRSPAAAAGTAGRRVPSLLAQVRGFLRRIPSLLKQLPGALRRVPRAAWICALIACLNAVCWSLITPPFQLPDEPAHYAYVQQLAETGTLPTSGESRYSQEELVALRDLHQNEVRWHPEFHAILNAAQQRTLEHDLAQPLARVGPGDAGVAASQPPLYYALQTIPYALASSGSLLDRLALMRLLSALMAGLTALFSYLFVREALPGVAWAWVVGGLGVAFLPLLGFMSGALNPDSMLFAVSAAVFFLLARGFRRGLTPGLAVAIGLTCAVGTLTKLNFLGLLPGVILGLIVLALRAARISRASAYRALALGVSIALAPLGVYVIVNLFSNHAGLGVASSGISLTKGHQGSLGREISYIWQLYLPRLPGMATDFPGIFPSRQIWFDRSVGFYGWLDTEFPVWAENIALIPAALLTILGIRALIGIRGTLRRRLLELAIYALMSLGVIVLIGSDSYLRFPSQAGTYAEPRYLLPMVPLVGAALALSARGAGRRWGPATGALIVVLILGYNIFSQLQVISRFYG